MPQLDINRTSEPSQWAMGQANLDALFNPINEGMDRSLKLTLADIARQQQQRDTNQAQRFLTERDATLNRFQTDRDAAQATATAKRDEALNEQITKRQRALKEIELARMGVILPKNPTDEQIAKAEREHMSKAAKRVIGIFDKEESDAKDEYEKAQGKYNRVFSKAASLEAKQQALAAVIADTSIQKMLKKEDFNRLKAAMVSGDPEKVVAEVASHVGENYFWDSSGKAQKLTDTFKTPLLEMMDGEKKAELAQLGSQLVSIQSNQNLINKQRYDAARQHVAWLDDEDYDRLIAPVDGAKVDIKGSKKDGAKTPEDDLNSAMAEYKPAPVDASGLADSLKVPLDQKMAALSPSASGGDSQNLMGQLQQARDLLSNLPDDIKQKIKSTALQLGVPQQEIESKDQILQNADITHPLLPQIVTETNRLLQAVTGQTAGTPPSAWSQRPESIAAEARRKAMAEKLKVGASAVGQGLSSGWEAAKPVMRNLGVWPREEDPNNPGSFR